MFRSALLFLSAAAVLSAQSAAPSAREAAIKADLAGQIDAMQKQAQVMVDTVFSFSELGFQEFETSKYLTGILEKEGFRFRALRRMRLAPEQARAFYAVHEERPFYEALVRFMTEGPVVVAALERADAVAHLRRTMGATDSRKAEAGTIRNLYGTDIERNAIHGSDSAENAAKEIAFFFGEAELL